MAKTGGRGGGAAPDALRLTRAERVDLWISRTLPRASRRANRAALRLTGGRLGAAKRGVPIALVTTTGRRSGRARTMPLMVLEEDGRVLVVASNGGFDAPPAWFLNLLADPAATVETRAGRRAVRARVLPDAEREAAWPRLAAHNPLWAAFQERTERPLAVVALE